MPITYTPIRRLARVYVPAADHEAASLGSMKSRRQIARDILKIAASPRFPDNLKPQTVNYLRRLSRALAQLNKAHTTN